MYLFQPIQLSHIQAITDAYVPILKLVYKGIDVDLLCSQIDAPYITSNFDVSDDNCITGMDEKSLLSLNGKIFQNSSFYAYLSHFPRMSCE